MPLKKDIALPNGMVAAFHRVDEYRVLRASHIGQYREKMLDLSIEGSLMANVAGYASRADMDAGAVAMMQQTVCFLFGSKIPNPLPPGVEPRLAIRKDEPTLTDIYTALKTSPDFDGATDI